MPHSIALFSSLAVLWLFVSGIFGPLLLSLGLVSCVFVTWLALRTEVIDHESFPLHLHPLRWAGYITWLLWEIVKANFDVTRRILSPSLPISPTVTRLPAKLSELSRVIYANSITLTPGTVSIDVDDDSILVHSLSQAAAQDLEAGTMLAKVSALERPPPDTDHV